MNDRLKINQYHQAISYFEKIKDNYPNQYKLLVNLGRAFYNTKEFSKAEKVLKEAQNSTNIDEQIFNLLGLINLNKDNYEVSIDYFKKALKIDKENYYVYNNLGYTYILKENYKEAKKYLNRAVSFNPEVSFIYNNLGIVYENLGNKTKALNNYRQALSINPEYEKAKKNINRVKNL
jgi:Flp pilus assembly protein TadD